MLAENKVFFETVGIVRADEHYPYGNLTSIETNGSGREFPEFDTFFIRI